MCMDAELEIRSQPTFCTSMYGLCFYINCPGKISLMKEIVCLIKWMGGMFVKEPNGLTTHMVTDSTLAKGYEYCFTFRVPIMTPDWIKYCWRNRYVPGFKALHHQGGYEIKPFAALSISLKGFGSGILKALKCSIQNNGGEVVPSSDINCTHLVLESNIANDVRFGDIPPHIPFVVSSDWLYSCLEQKQRAYEEFFTCLCVNSLDEIELEEGDETISSSVCEESDKSNSLNDITSTSIGSSSNVADYKRQDMKRKFAFEELCQTEQNYIQCLKSLLEIKFRASKASKCPILDPAEENLIFSNIGDLIELHEAIYTELQKLKDDWKNEAQIGNIFIKMDKYLKKHYVTYTNGFKARKEYLKQCVTNNARFRELLESMCMTKERREDLYIRPIQRLCSVDLLLQEIRKNTRDDNPDKKSLNEALQVIRNVLKLMDNDRARYKNYEYLFCIHDFIENCPVDLVNSNRDFIVEFSAQEIVNKKHTLGADVEFFLFSDVLEITKPRSTTFGLWTDDGSVKRNKSKPFKHIAMLSLSIVLHVVRFQDSTDANSLFGFLVRDVNNEKKTKFYCFKYTDEENMDEVILKIAKLLCSQRDSSKTPEDFILESPSKGRVSIDPIYSQKENTLAMGVVKKASHFVNNLIGRGSKPRQKLRRSKSCSDIFHF
uniref:Protein ECT2 n=1 Tax=Homalodisca liturata TaxID=320908 RepID=A0A1B6IU11_9HEMI